MIEGSQVVGVRISDSENNLQWNNRKFGYDAVVLAVGHSARDTYEMLLTHNVDLVQKDFAVSSFLSHLEKSPPSFCSDILGKPSQFASLSVSASTIDYSHCSLQHFVYVSDLFPLLLIPFFFFFRYVLMNLSYFSS